MATKKTTKKTTAKKTAKREIPVNLVTTDIHPTDLGNDTVGVPDMSERYFVKEKTGRGMTFVEVKPEFCVVVDDSGEVNVEWKVPSNPKAKELFVADGDGVSLFGEHTRNLCGTYKAFGTTYDFTFHQPTSGEFCDGVYASFFGKDSEKVYKLQPGKYPVVDGNIEVRIDDEKENPDMLPIDEAEAEINWRTVKLSGSKKPVCETCSVKKEALKIMQDAIDRVRKMGYFPVYDNADEKLCLMHDSLWISSDWEESQAEVQVPDSACASITEVPCFYDEHYFVIDEKKLSVDKGEDEE